MSAYEIHLFTLSPNLKDTSDPVRTGVKVIYCDKREEALDIADREKDSYRHIEVYRAENPAVPIREYRNGEVVRR